ncbi:MAG: aspartate aminotransferase family protein [Cytophagales bacterium]|nr:aspartate aminotransferase family protein [Cytophagales bacterium]
MLTQRQLFQQYVAQTSDFPLALEIERAEGVYLYDKDKSYIDLISGIGVSNVGHRHPKVIQAIQEQLDKYLHIMVYGEYVQSPQVKLAQALSATLPEHLNNVYFLNSGSEAVEGAIKLAKRYTGKPDVITFKNAYHGSSHGALSASGDEQFKQNFRPLVPGFKHLKFGCEKGINKIDSNVAAVLIETVQGEAGVVQADTAYFRQLREKCDETETLLIFDEIQCGSGRTGKLWAFEHYGVTPDILVSAKGLGGGMPIGCFIAPQEIMGVLKNDPILGHISTFGGHPVNCAAALATLKTIEEEKLLETVPQKEAMIRDLLQHPKIKEIRSIGLMMAVEFESFEVVKPIIDKAIELGVITDWFLFNDYSMRIAPPLTIAEDEIRVACGKIMEAIENP